MLQEWSTMIDGDSENNVMSIRVDVDDNMYVVGYTKSSTIGVEPSYSATPGRYGEFDGFVIKCASSDGVIRKTGASAWTRRVGGTANDFIYSIALAGNQAIYFAGASRSNTLSINEYQTGANNNLGGSDGFLSKYDSGGRLLWVVRVGGTSNDVITSLAYDNTFVFVSGYTNSNLLTGELAIGFHGGDDCFIAQYNDLGNQLWITRIGGSSNDRIYGSMCDMSGNLYICGMTESSTIGNEYVQNNLGQMDGFVAKYTTMGDLVWFRRIGGTGNDEVKTLTIDANNFIYVGGITTSSTIANESTATVSGTNQVFIAKYSFDGSLQWTRRFQTSVGDTTITSITCGVDNSIFICGTTNSLTIQGETGSDHAIGYVDSYVAKFTTSGTFRWSHRIGYSLTTTSINTITLVAENLYVGGQIDYNIEGSSELSNIDGFFSKYTDTTYNFYPADTTESVAKIEYCLKPFSRKSRVGTMSMCSNVLYANLVTSGNNPKLTKAFQYSSYINTRKPMKYIYSAPTETLSTSGIITTVAGTGTSGTSGDGGLATLATFQSPRCCNVDISGNIYVADDSNKIRKITIQSGIITTVAGYGVQSQGSQNVGDGGAATSATMNSPLDVVIDSSNAMYISDSANRRIRKVDPISDIITTIAGTGYGTFPNLVNLGDDGFAIDATFRLPHGLCLDSSLNIYIADTGNSRVRKIDASTGMITTIAGTFALAFNLGDGDLAINANLREPKAICLDSAGNIFIADSGNRRIRRIDAITGIITTIAGTGNSSFNGDGIVATSANLGIPVDIIMDTADNMYIADITHQRVRKITATTGIITTVAGNGTVGYSGDNGYATSATLNNPNGIAIDTLGNLYIADTMNYVIRKVSA